jgi:hypothetical protein
VADRKQRGDKVVKKRILVVQAFCHGVPLLALTKLLSHCSRQKAEHPTFANRWQIWGTVKFNTDA